jgi:hypothetical protein
MKKNPLLPPASLQPTATMAYWANAQLAGPRRWPWTAHGAWMRPERGQHTWHGAEFYGATVGYRRQRLRLDHPHGSSC